MRYFKNILKKNKVYVCIYVLLGILCSFLTNLKASYFQKVVDGLTAQTATVWSIAGYGLLLTLLFLLNYADNYPEKRLEHGFYLDFKLLALRKISVIDYSEYQRLGTGKLVQCIENGSEAGKNILFSFWLCLIRSLIPTALFSIFFIWRISLGITVAILIGYILVFIITNLLLKSLYRIKERILTNEEKLNHFLVRSFMEMPIFRVARQFPGEVRKAESAKEQIVRSKTKMTMIHEAFFTIFALLVAFLDVGILLYAWSSKTLSIGAVVALLSLLENAYTPIAIFNVLYVQYKLDRSAFGRYENFLNSRSDPQLEAGKSYAESDNRIVVQNLSFQYGDRRLFDNLELTIRPGEKIAFVGESGSGKSTLLKLLAGLLKYESGTVRIGKNELKDLYLETLYDHLSYLSQDSAVFAGTLRENIVFDRPVPDEALWNALEKVQLGSLCKTMEHGLDTLIGERGITLSGGERQRVALARLWFEQKEITILDEATSALDNLTEKTVMDAILSLLKERTVIAVAHKLDSIAGFDRIVVFREGTIVGEGSFQELLETNEYFARLYWANRNSEP